ncbi:MAG: MSCRAMM family protein [Thermoleophilia bacterium]
MANSIARQPWRLGAILLLLAAFVAGLLIVQISLSGSAETASEAGPIVDQAGTIGSENTGTQSLGAGAGAAAGSTGAGNPDLAGLTADSDSSFYISFVGSTGTSGNVSDPTPPEDQPTGAGSISGNVYEATGHGNDHVPRITVYLARSDGVFTGATAMTGEDSRFHFEGLAPGEYKLYFFDLAGTFEGVWYGAPATPAGIPITVASGRDVYVMQRLSRADPEDGAISGRVTDAAGNGIAGVDVLAYFVDEANGVRLLLQGSAVTDAEGNYEVTGLPADASTTSSGGASHVTGYKVQFAPSGETYSSQWYDGQPTHLTAKLMQLKPAEKLGGIDAVLTGGGTISGRITLEGGAAAPSTLVDIFDASGVIVDTKIAAGDGTYQSDMLPAGTYHLRAVPRSSEYSAKWYENGNDLSSSAAIQVLAGKDTGGLDLVLERVTSTPVATGETSVGDAESRVPLESVIHEAGVDETAGTTAGAGAADEAGGGDTADASGDDDADDGSQSGEISDETGSVGTVDQTGCSETVDLTDSPSRSRQML